MTKKKQSQDCVQAERYEAVLCTINDCKTWLNLKQVVAISGVTKGSCNKIIGQLLCNGVIAERTISDSKSANALKIYANLKLAQKEARQRELNSEFLQAKSAYSVSHTLAKRKQSRGFTPSNPLKDLAMLSRNL